MRTPRPHPRGSIVAYIAIGVLLAAFLVAMFFQDDDPNTDDAAGAGVLAFIVGLVLIVVYLGIAKKLNVRDAVVTAGDEGQVSATPDTRRWVRRNLGPISAAFAAVVVVVVASTFAPSPETAVPAADSEGELVIDTSLNEVAVVQKAAGRNTAHGDVSKVFCQVEGACIVTHTLGTLGSAHTCQTWAVRPVNGVPVAMATGELYPCG